MTWSTLKKYKKYNEWMWLLIRALMWDKQQEIICHAIYKTEYKVPVKKWDICMCNSGTPFNQILKQNIELIDDNHIAQSSFMECKFNNKKLV